MWGIANLGLGAVFYKDGVIYACVNNGNLAQAALCNPHKPKDPDITVYSEAIQFSFNGNIPPIVIDYRDINYFYYYGVVNPFVTYNNINEFQQAANILFIPAYLIGAGPPAGPPTIAVTYDPLNFTSVTPTPGVWTSSIEACTVTVTDCNEPAPLILIVSTIPTFPAGTRIYFAPGWANGAGTYSAIIYNDTLTTFPVGVYTVNVQACICGVSTFTTIIFNFA